MMEHAASLLISFVIFSAAIILFINELSCGCADPLSFSTAGTSSSDPVNDSIFRPAVMYPIVAFVIGLFLYKAYHFKRDRRRARRRKKLYLKKLKHDLQVQDVMRNSVRY